MQEISETGKMVLESASMIMLAWEITWLDMYQGEVKQGSQRGGGLFPEITKGEDETIWPVEKKKVVGKKR